MVEVLLFVSVAINAALLIFIAGVLRKVMDDMDEGTFKHFLESFYRHSVKSPFMVTILTIPTIGALPYFYFFGFGSRLILAGLALWLVGGAIAKIIKLPIYKAVPKMESGDIVRLREARQKLNAGNMLQAILNSVAALLMAITFIS